MASELFNFLPMINPNIILFLILLPISHILHESIQKDYHAFLALGPGGTPSTFGGYLRICFLRLFALRNPLVPPSVPRFLYPNSGYLRNLPKRSGPRPKVEGLAPHRQINQKGSSAMYTALTAVIADLACCHPERLCLGTSCFEKHSTGIFCLPNAQNRVTCNGEVCHSHPSDGSMHLTLHPADVNVILEQGWGERHPLARDSWWWRAKIVPAGFVMVYAPRNAAELNCITEIIRALAWWVSGRELQRENGRELEPGEAGDQAGSSALERVAERSIQPWRCDSVGIVMSGT